MEKDIKGNESGNGALSMNSSINKMEDGVAIEKRKEKRSSN